MVVDVSPILALLQSAAAVLVMWVFVWGGQVWNGCETFALPLVFALLSDDFLEEPMLVVAAAAALSSFVDRSESAISLASKADAVLEQSCWVF